MTRLGGPLGRHRHRAPLLTSEPDLDEVDVALQVKAGARSLGGGAILVHQGPPQQHPVVDALGEDQVSHPADAVHVIPVHLRNPPLLTCPGSRGESSCLQAETCADLVGGEDRGSQVANCKALPAALIVLV